MVSRDSLISNSIFGKAIQIGSFGLMIWARIALGSRSFHAAANPTQGGLVTSGPYHFIRHPIYASLLFFIWTAALSHFSGPEIVLATVATIGASIRIFTEERLIIAMYPEYREYAARTKRIIPYVL